MKLEAENSLHSIRPIPGEGEQRPLQAGEPSRKILFVESIRGIAAFLVVLHHLKLAMIFPFCGTDPRLKNIKRVIDVLTNGPLSVRVFFILSGFVLSLSFLRSGNRSVVFSMAIRRYFRLLVPVFVSILISWAALQSGVYRVGDALALMPNDAKWGIDMDLASQISFLGALQHGLYGVFFCDNGSILNSPLWTMEIELRGSFLLFAVLLCVGKFRYRGWVYAALIVIFRGYYADFICGIVFCELYVSRGWASRPLNAPLWAGLLMMGGGVALGGGIFNIHNWIAENLHLPLGTSWGTISSALILGGAIISHPLQRALEWRPFVFLGKNSFSLYVIHQVLILALGTNVYIGLQSIAWGPVESIIVTSAACVIASLVAAWGLYYIGDLQGIRLGRWVEKTLRGWGTAARHGLQPAVEARLAPKEEKE